MIAFFRTVNAILGQVRRSSSVGKSDLKSGDEVVVTTENSVYSIRVHEDATYSVRGDVHAVHFVAGDVTVKPLYGGAHALEDGVGLAGDLADLGVGELSEPGDLSLDHELGHDNSS